MLLERNEAWKMASMVRGTVSPEEMGDAVIILIYEILAERQNVNTSLLFDKNYLEITKRINTKSLKGVKKELEKYSSEELRDMAFYFVSNPYEMGSRFIESSNTSLNQLVISLLRIEAGDMVFDLGSGNGSFLVNVHKHCEKRGIELKDLFGLEINTQAAEISKANLLISGVESINIKNADFIDGVDPMYNRGFVFPPLGMRTPDYKKIKSQMFDYTFSPRNSYEWVFVDRLLKGLIGRNRRAVAIMSPRCMFNDADKEYRDNLIKAGLVETIIDLPAGSLNFCSVKPVVVVFSEGNDKTKVVDATSLADKVIGKFSKFELDYKKVLELLSEADYVNNDELLRAHSLSASSLLAANGEVFTGTPLHELAEVFAGSQYTLKNFEEMFKDEATGYRILTSSDINDGSVEWNKLQAIDYKDDKFDKYAVKQNDVVITAKSSKVKIVVVDIEPKEKILVTGGMLIVRPNTEKLNPTYLKIFLDSDKGQVALKMIQRGSIIISINAKDLANVLIPDATIEKQNNISKKYNNKLSTYIALKEELTKIENQLRSFDLDEMKED